LGDEKHDTTKASQRENYERRNFRTQEQMSAQTLEMRKNPRNSPRETRTCCRRALGKRAFVMKELLDDTICTHFWNEKNCSHNPLGDESKSQHNFGEDILCGKTFPESEWKFAMET
jgi:hypothetical protein